MLCCILFSFFSSCIFGFFSGSVFGFFGFSIFNFFGFSVLSFFSGSGSGGFSGVFVFCFLLRRHVVYFFVRNCFVFVLLFANHPALYVWLT